MFRKVFLSKSISEDCKKLDSLLTKSVADYVKSGGTSPKDTLEKLGEKIEKFATENFSNECSNVERHQQQMSALQERVKNLKNFLWSANALKDFNAFYKEEDGDGSFGKIQHYALRKTELSALDNKIKELVKSEANLDLKSVFEQKINQIEEKILGEDQIREFCNKVRVSGFLNPEDLAVRCNKLVNTLKSISNWLTCVDDDFRRGEGERYSRIEQEDSYPDMLGNSSNNALKQQLESYLQKNTNQYPGCDIKTYRGIPYIADRKGNLVPIKQ